LIVGLDVEFDVAGVDTGGRHVDAVGLTSIRQFALNRCSLGAVEVIRASHPIAFAAYLLAEWITTWTIPKASKIYTSQTFAKISGRDTRPAAAALLSSRRAM
jgi:hypothetical protein